jgi:hypothetical protein
MHYSPPRPKKRYRVWDASKPPMSVMERFTVNFYNSCPRSSVRNPTLGINSRAERELGPPLALPWFLRYFPPAVAKTYVVTFRSHKDDMPSKFIVVADNMRAAIDEAWKHGGADFQSRFDKSTAQAEEMKQGGAAGSLIVVRRLTFLTPPVIRFLH